MAAAPPSPPRPAEPRTVAQQTIPARAWALLVALALIWGTSFTANRAAVHEVGVLTTVAFRVSGGALALGLSTLARGRWQRLAPRDWAALALMGLLNNVLPFSLIVWGQSHIPSGLAAILNGATAFFTVLLAPLLFPDERLTPARGAGVALGIAGVTLTIGLDKLAALDVTSLAQLAILGATLSYALAGLFARAALRGLGAEQIATGMMAMAALMLVPAALWREGVPTLDYSPAAWSALAYLALVASALAYLGYFAVLRLAGAGNLSLVTLMIPPVSVLLGRLAFDERLAPTAYAGFALLAAGLVLIDGRLLPRKNPRESGCASG